MGFFILFCVVVTLIALARHRSRHHEAPAADHDRGAAASQSTAFDSEAPSHWDMPDTTW